MPTLWCKSHALETWEAFNRGDVLTPEQQFPARVKADKKITDLIPSAELEQIFSLERYTKHADFIFKRVFS